MFFYGFKIIEYMPHCLDYLNFFGQNQTSVMNKTIHQVAKFEDLKFGVLEHSPSKLTDITNLCAKSFTLMNPIWKKMMLPFEEVLQVMRQRVQHVAQKGIIHVTVIIKKVMEVPETGQITMMASYIDINILTQMKYEIIGGFPWWRQIEDVGKQLESNFFKQLSPKKGTYAYGDFGATKIQYSNRRNAQLFWAQSCNWLRQNGFKKLYFRSSNPITTKVFCESFGATQGKKVYLQRKGLEDMSMELIQLDLQAMGKLPMRSRL